MAIGPVQLIALGFPHPEFHGEIIEELEKLRASDTVRVIDSLAVYKDDDGELEVMTERLPGAAQEAITARLQQLDPVVPIAVRVRLSSRGRR